MPHPLPELFALVLIASSFVSFAITSWFNCKVRGLGTNFMFGTTLIDNGAGKAVYLDFLPTALAEGRYLAVPGPLVVGS